MNSVSSKDGLPPGFLVLDQTSGGEKGAKDGTKAREGGSGTTVVWGVRETYDIKMML